MSPSAWPAGSLAPAAPPSSVLEQRLFALWLALGLALLATVVGMLVPFAIPLSFLQEEGPVERGTVWVYLLAILCVPLLRWHGLRTVDALAGCVLLAAMAAREADLHTALFGISILKSKFYLQAPAGQIAVALCVLAPVVLSGLWLVARHASAWRRAPARWQPAAVTLTVLVGTMVVAKVLDRTPDTLNQLHLLHLVPQAGVYVMLALEEILEFALPAFAIVALLQCRAHALRMNVTK